jgi:hypothetical protein
MNNENAIGQGVPAPADQPVIPATPVAMIYAWSDPVTGAVRYLQMPLLPTGGPAGMPTDLGADWQQRLQQSFMSAFPAWAAPLRSSATDLATGRTLDAQPGLGGASELQGGFFVPLDDATLANVKQIARHASATLRMDVEPQEVILRQFKELYSQPATNEGVAAQYEQAVRLWEPNGGTRYREGGFQSGQRATAMQSTAMQATSKANAQSQANKSVKANTGTKGPAAKTQATSKANAQAAKPPAAPASRSHHRPAGQNNRNGVAGAAPPAGADQSSIAPINETNSAPAESRELANV